MFFFTPVLALMNRARYAHKFLLIFVVFMLPYCWLSLSKLTEVNASLQQARHELAGLHALEQYLPFYRQALELAGLHVIGYARDKDDAKSEIARQSDAFLRQAAALSSWLQSSAFADIPTVDADPGASLDPKLRTQSLASQMIAHSRHLHDIVASMKEVAARAQLSQDSDPQIHSNVDVLLNQLLPLYEVLTQTRTLDSYMAAYGFLESSSGPTITNQLNALERHAGTSSDTSEARRLMREAAQSAAERYRRETVETYSKSGYFDQDSMALWHERYLAYAPQIDSLNQASHLLFDDTSGLLQTRIEANGRQLLLWSTFLLVVVGLLVYLFAGFFLSVRGAIRDLTSATRRMAEGDLRQPIATQARDELGDLAEAFNAMQ